MFHAVIPNQPFVRLADWQNCSKNVEIIGMRLKKGKADREEDGKRLKWL